MPISRKPPPPTTSELLAPYAADIDRELVRRRLQPELAGGSP